MHGNTQNTTTVIIHNRGPWGDEKFKKNYNIVAFYKRRVSVTENGSPRDTSPLFTAISFCPAG